MIGQCIRVMCGHGCLLQICIVGKNVISRAIRIYRAHIRGTHKKKGGGGKIHGQVFVRLHRNVGGTNQIAVKVISNSNIRIYRESPNITCLCSQVCVYIYVVL